MRAGAGCDGQSGGLHVFIHNPGEHPICNASRLQHDGLGSYLDLIFIFVLKGRGQRPGETAVTEAPAAGCNILSPTSVHSAKSTID
jgi:hypothetical protein